MPKKKDTIKNLKLKVEKLEHIVYKFAKAIPLTKTEDKMVKSLLW